MAKHGLLKSDDYWNEEDSRVHVLQTIELSWLNRKGKFIQKLDSLNAQIMDAISQIGEANAKDN